MIVDIVAGDLLYFPSHWYHEVHNLTPDSLGITNAVLNSFFLAMTVNTIATTPVEILGTIKMNLLRAVGRLKECTEIMRVVEDFACSALKIVPVLCKLLIAAYQERDIKNGLKKLKLRMLTTKDRSRLDQLSHEAEEIIISLQNAHNQINPSSETIR
jgi:hypothetical protein